MDGNKFPIEISFKRGKTGSKAVVETTVFLRYQNGKRENWKKVKPNNIERNIGNRGRDVYNLCSGEYRIVTKTRKNNGKYFSFTRVLTIKEEC